MNTRIRELIAQATTKEEFYPAGCNGYPEYRYDFDKEKFAELIVRECISVIDKCKDEAIDNRWNVDEAMSVAEMELLEHFGVSES